MEMAEGPTLLDRLKQGPKTRQNRGTLEKYYQAIARTFRADDAVFTGAGTGVPGDEARATLKAVVSNMIDRVTGELGELVAKSPAHMEASLLPS